MKKKKGESRMTVGFFASSNLDEGVAFNLEKAICEVGFEDKINSSFFGHV